MKTKIDFITNSSSTSFVTISHSGKICPPDYGNFNEVLTVDNDFGQTDFGWEYDEIYYTGSKIIFAYLQVLYSESEEYKNMLEKVIKECTGVKEIVWNITNEYSANKDEDYGYIDHQSAYPDNMDMFESEEELKNFLFNMNSSITLDNDNH